MNVLTQSTAPTIRVQWCAGAVVVDTYTDTFCFDLYDYVFALGLLSNQTGNPSIIQDANYYSNFTQFIVNLFNAESAIEFGGDVYSAQSALDRNQNLINNDSLYF